MTDTSAEPAVQDLPATRERRIGAYIGVPVVRFLSVLASLVADEVEAATAADEQHQALRERITRVIRETSFEMVSSPSSPCAGGGLRATKH